MAAPAVIPERALPRLDRAGFLAAFGDLFEHSPWVAEGAWAAAPFADRTALLSALIRCMREAPPDRQLALIRAHPDLADRARIAAGSLSAESAAEQASARLDQCSPAEFARFQDLNDAYKARFGFPFILAVKGRSRAEILAAFEARLANSPEAEFRTALDQIAEIARLRLDARLGRS